MEHLTADLLGGGGGLCASLRANHGCPGLLGKKRAVSSGRERGSERGGEGRRGGVPGLSQLLELREGRWGNRQPGRGVRGARGGGSASGSSLRGGVRHCRQVGLRAELLGHGDEGRGMDDARCRCGR